MNTKFVRYRYALTFLVLVASAWAIHAENAPSTHPEVKKTVDAFAGHWTLTGTATESDAKSAAPVKASIDCKLAALGVAVNCLIAADVSGSRIEAVAVVGYSPDEHLVRWMEISSSGEYHNHRGPWKGETIQFEPLAYTAEGVKMTEYFTLSFPSAGKMIFKATTQTPAGKSRLELVGVKRHLFSGTP